MGWRRTTRGLTPPTRPSRNARSSKAVKRKISVAEEPKKNENHQKLIPIPKEKQKSAIEKTSEDGNLYYLCPYCSVESNVLRNIKDHINSKHEHSSWYKCFECDFISFWTSSIRDHLSEKHDIHLKSFQEVDNRCLSMVDNSERSSKNSAIESSDDMNISELWKD